MPDTISEARRIANAENAKKSTGPRTPEGKRKSSLNATRSKLHCQIECLPAEDLAVYQKLLDEIVAELEPVGPSERFYATAIAQSMWRLNHAMSLMQSIFAHGHAEKIDAMDTGNEDVDNALVAAQTFLEKSRELNNLTTYEARIRRALANDRISLKELQTERKTKYAKAAQEATDLIILGHIRNEPYQPAADEYMPASAHGGFVFSAPDLIRRYNRQQHLNDAAAFRQFGRDPHPRPKPQPEKTPETDMAA